MFRTRTCHEESTKQGLTRVCRAAPAPKTARVILRSRLPAEDMGFYVNPRMDGIEDPDFDLACLPPRQEQSMGF